MAHPADVTLHNQSSNPNNGIYLYVYETETLHEIIWRIPERNRNHPFDLSV